MYRVSVGTAASVEMGAQAWDGDFESLSVFERPRKRNGVFKFQKRRRSKSKLNSNTAFHIFFIQKT
jgi:hypothetical protein